MRFWNNSLKINMTEFEKHVSEEADFVVNLRMPEFQQLTIWTWIQRKLIMLRENSSAIMQGSFPKSFLSFLV